MNHKIKQIFLSILLFINIALATGPSSVQSIIIPIAINEQGDVLCKSKFTKNAMGAHDFMPIQYGLFLVKDKKITMLEEFVLEPYSNSTSSDVDSLINIYNDYQKQFDNMQFSENAFLLNSHYESLKNSGFSQISLDDYKASSDFSVLSFQNTYQQSYFSSPQYSLYLTQPFSAKWEDCINCKINISKIFEGVKIQYQINHQLWLIHAYNDDIQAIDDVGQAELYSYPYYDSSSQTKIMLEYDIQTVNSIIFLPNEKDL